MDRSTIRYYEENAEALFQRYLQARGGISRYFHVAFPPGSRILDIGSGSGRDLQALIREEYDAYGIEPCGEFRDLAITADPALSDRLQHGSIPGLASRFEQPFDGLVCSAVFMHIPEELQFDAAFEMRNLLKPNGRLLLSAPLFRVSLDGRDENGRLFVPITPEALELLFERIGFQRIGKWEDPDSLGRPD
jgi:SAM-dependent methyltransferase